MQSSAPAAASPAPSFIKPRAFPILLDRSARRSRAWSRLTNGLLCDAAADVEHVPPLPCAARLPHRTGDLHFRRYLERQSDRAQAGRRLFCQNERATLSVHNSRPLVTGDAGADCRHSGRQHPFALPRRPLHLKYRGPNAIFRATEVAKGQELGWFSTARPSSSLRRSFSCCATPSTTARGCGWASR